MTTSFVIRILLAVVAGGLVGAEREFRLHAAGIRTHALVSTGAALFTLAGIDGSAGPVADPMRVAAQVVSGIGFVGAGAILQDDSGVRGLTTASTIWISGALGMLCGVGNITLALAGIGAAILILSSRRPLRWIMTSVGRTTEASVEIEYDVGHGTIGPIIRVMEDTDAEILKLTMSDEKGVRVAGLTMRLPGAEFARLAQVVDDLEERDEVHHLRFWTRNGHLNNDDASSASRFRLPSPPWRLLINQPKD